MSHSATDYLIRVKTTSEISLTPLLPLETKAFTQTICGIYIGDRYVVVPYKEIYGTTHIELQSVKPKSLATSGRLVAVSPAANIALVQISDNRDLWNLSGIGLSKGLQHLDTVVSIDAIAGLGSNIRRSTKVMHEELRIDYYKYTQLAQFYDFGLLGFLDAAIDDNYTGAPVTLRDGSLCGIIYSTNHISPINSRRCASFIPVAELWYLLDRATRCVTQKCAVIHRPNVAFSCLDDGSVSSAEGTKETISKLVSYDPMGLFKHGDHIVSVDGIPITSSGLINHPDGVMTDYRSYCIHGYDNAKESILFEVIREKRSTLVSVSIDSCSHRHRVPYLGRRPCAFVFEGYVFFEACQDELDMLDLSWIDYLSRVGNPVVSRRHELHDPDGDNIGNVLMSPAERVDNTIREWGRSRVGMHAAKANGIAIRSVVALYGYVQSVSHGVDIRVITSDVDTPDILMTKHDDPVWAHRPPRIYD